MQTTRESKNMKKNNTLKMTLALALAATVVVGCTTTEVRETPPGSGVYSTNVVVDPKLTTALETIGAINTATEPVNPASAPITITLAAISAIAAWVAKRKNDALNNTSNQLKAVIQGVEAVPSVDVKAAIQKQATVLGVESDLYSRVQKTINGQL